MPANSSGSNINLGLGVLPDYQGNDPQIFQEIVKIYNAIKILQSVGDATIGDSGVPNNTSFIDTDSLLNIGNLTRATMLYSETVNYGQMIAIKPDGSIGLAQGAGAGSPITARGYCSQQGGVQAGSFGQIQLQGIVAATGLTPGGTYYLNTNGNITLGSPGSGYIQVIGFAVSTTRLYINPVMQ